MYFFFLAGIGATCKHSAALYIWVNEIYPVLEKQNCKTSNPKAWGTPKKHMQQLYPRGATLKSMFGGRGVDHDYKYSEERSLIMKNLCEETSNEVSCFSLHAM